MGHRVLASEILASVAPIAHEFLNPIARDNKSAPAGAIACRLYCIVNELKFWELYQISLQTQDLCSQALHDLVTICKVSELTRIPAFYDSSLQHD